MMWTIAEREAYCLLVSKIWHNWCQGSCMYSYFLMDRVIIVLGRALMCMGEHQWGFVNVYVPNVAICKDEIFGDD